MSCVVLLVLYPSARPLIWKRKLPEFDQWSHPNKFSHSRTIDHPTTHDYDPVRGRLKIEEFDEIPEGVTHPAELRRYFNTQVSGKSASGHYFPNQLNPLQKDAVLEYLKSL